MRYFMSECELTWQFFSFFYWRIIALQNFVVFCQTSTWISHRDTYIPSLLNLPPISSPSYPSRLIQSPCLSPESYSKFPLPIYFAYGNVSFHVTLSIHLTLSSPLPHVHTSVLCLFLHCCLANTFINTIFLDAIYIH